jgi:predicted ATPase/class 3 adenylate cyclase
MDIGGWLRNLGLGQYEGAFRDNEIDGEVLPNLTGEDLKDVGVEIVGHRRKILTAIAELRAAPSPPQDAQDAAERRQLTVMFCDLVGSTALSAGLDPEDMRRVIRVYQDACSGVVARYDGFVAKFMGDGILAYFGFPRAHEDDAARAVHAGLEIAEVVAGLRSPAREPLAVRVGIATGLVVVGDLVGRGSAQEQAVVGDTPNLAARLQGLAEAGGVVIAGSTRRLLGDRFRLRELGKHAVKGLAEPVEAWAALDVSQSESRFEAAHATRLTGFVGRETESAELLARQRRAWAGAGQIVLISGEAGIGKSRLSAWLAEQVTDTPHTRLRYQCSPYHRDSALYPFVQQLERAAGVAPLESPEAKLQKLEKVLALSTDRVTEVAPLFAAMLSIPPGARYARLNLSPAQQRRQTLSALLDQMEGLARKQPVLMMFEDVHWADATTLEVIDLSIERVRRLPVLLMITYRPEFEPPWKGLPDVATAALQRLDRVQAETLIEQVTGGRKLPAEVMAQIVAKTDGVPLFVEELTKNVLESGLLVEEPDRFRLDGPLPPLAIPSTLQDSLMARLDRLAAVKEIAQIGAAIGREFAYPLLQAVAGREEAALRSSLMQLEDSELVFRSGDPPAALYTFKHALVQDTAYESLLKSRRQILHQRIAEALRDKFPDVVEAEPELIAEHYTRAGLTDPAVVHWGKAGDLALRRSAFKEAIAHLGKAIEMTEAIGEAQQERSKLRLQVSYGNATIALRGHGAPETAVAFERARELAASAEDVGQSLSVAYGLWAGHYVRGELTAMRERAGAFLRDCESHVDSGESCVAYRIQGVTHWFAGDFVAARSSLERSLAIFNPERDRDLSLRFGQDVGVAAMAYSALVLWALGEFDLARQQALAVSARTAEGDHAATTAYGNMHLALIEMQARNPQRALAAANALSVVANERQMPMFMVVSTVMDGWIEREVQRGDHGLAQMRDGVLSYREQQMKVFAPLFESELARSEAESGENDAALSTIDQSLVDADRTGQRWHHAELHRTRGEILLRQNPADPSPAEAAFLAAIAVARTQKARAFELRAALALAKLYESTSRLVEAHDVLDPALEGFSSTPEFPEIGEAKALFEALAADERVKADAARRAQRLKFQTNYGQAIMWSKGYAAEETKAALARVGELTTEKGKAETPLDVYHARFHHSLFRGELESARETAESFLRAAEQAARPAETAVAHRLLGTARLVQGDFTQARARFEQTLRIYDPERDREAKFRLGPDSNVAATTYLAVATWCVGDIGRARELMDEALARAVESAHAPTLVNMYFGHAWLEILRGDEGAARRTADAVIALSREHGLAFHLTWGALPLAWARAKFGDRDAGSTEFRKALADYASQGNKLFLPIFQGLLAEIETEREGAEAALAEINEALPLASETGEHWFDAGLHRIRGEILLKQNPADPAPAEAAFLAAIAIAQSQNARSFELRAALALAKLYESTNRPVEAHDVLEPALEGFSPTSEFPEIAEAKALFEALAADDTVKAETARLAQRLKLQTNYGQAVMWSKGYAAEETRAAFARVGEVASEMGKAEAPLDAYHARFHYSLFRGELGAALETAENFLRAAERAVRPAETAAAHRLMAIVHLVQGDLAQSRTCFEQTLRIYDPVRDREAKFRLGQDSKVAASAYLAIVAWLFGGAERARQFAVEAGADAAESAHAPTLANTFYQRAVFEILRDDAEAVLSAAESMVALCKEHGLALYLTLAALPLAWARAMLHEREAGLAELRGALADYAGQGCKVQLPFFQGLLAEIQAAGGDADAARVGIDAALALADETGEHWYDAELHRTRGEILFRQNPADPFRAEAAFLAAIAVARTQKARAFELRAALALAKLYESTRRPVEAHDLLGPALERFSPTPEFPEIAEAKALFEALAADERVKADAARRAQRLKLQTSYGKAVMWSRGFAAEETQAAFNRAQELATGVGDSAERFVTYYGQWAGRLLRADLEGARKTAERFLAEAVREARTTETAMAHRAYGLARFAEGGFGDAQAHLEEALRITDPGRDAESQLRFGMDTSVAASVNLAHVCWQLGEIERARSLMNEALALAHERAHAPSLAGALHFQALFEMLRGDTQAVRLIAESLVAVSREHGLALYLANGALYLAWATARLAGHDASVEVMQAAVAARAALSDQGNRLWVPFFGGLLAEIELQRQDSERALAQIDEAIALGTATGEHWVDAFLHRIRGEALLKRDAANTAVAEEAFLTAIGLAQTQRARSFGLRAALALAKLYQSTGRATDAHDVLVPALQGFPPTPEFPEIAEAQAFLAAASGDARS